MLPKEEDILISMPTPIEQKRKIDSSKMTPRPPFLSPFDYIFYLKRQVEKEKLENGNYESDELKDNSYQSGLSIETPKLSELLRKLVEDLRIAQGSFVDEFIDEPHHGISWLLDLLRSSLNRQQCPGMVISGGRDQPNKNKMIKNRDRQHQLKRAMTDEYDCLLCLKYATEANSKALVKILSHRNGLLTLASCIVSNLTKSRVIALELLTKVCNTEPDGDCKVLEAMSTMRIIFGESVRFKLLVAILNSSNGSSANGFESTVLMFLNSLLAKCPNPAERVRLQCELEEAGLDFVSLEKRIKEKSIPPDDQIWSELRTWRDKYINVGDLIKSNKMLTRESNKLREEIDLLQRALTKLEEDKINLMHIEREMKEKAEDLEAEVMLLRARLSESGIKITCRRRSKSTGRPGSDSSDPISGAADSGRWSDSEGGGETTSGGRSSSGNDIDKTKPINPQTHSSNNNVRMKETSSTTPTTTTGSIMMNDDCIDDQNVRNEDIFIYIPSIRPPANFKGYSGSEHLRRDNINLSTHSNHSNQHHQHHNNQHTHHNSNSNPYHQNQFNHHQSMSSKKVKRSENNRIDNTNGGGVGAGSVNGGNESRWRLRQRVENNNNDEDNYSSEESKPTVVDVYPKKNEQNKNLINPTFSPSSKPSTGIKSTKISSSKSSTINQTNAIPSSPNVITDQSINHESTCSASIVGADCEDTEFTLDWQYPKVNGKLDSHGTIYLTSENHNQHHHRSNQSTNCKEENRKRSQSTGYLNESSVADHSMIDKNDMRSSESWTQFLMRSRGSSMTSLNEAYIATNNGLGRSLDPIGRGPGYGSSVNGNGPVGNGKRSGSQVTSSGKSKNLASSLQSYFFSGGNSTGPSTATGQSNNIIKTSSSSSTSSSSHKGESAEREAIKESIDSSKSFPLPNVFKKNFIAKGHGNCGLYSGVTGSKGSSSCSTSSERSTNNVNKLVHREIAKEIGAFY